MTVAAAEVSVADWTLQRAAVDGRHRDCVHTVRVLQRMRGHGVQLVCAAHLDVELSLYASGAEGAEVAELDALGDVLHVQRRDLRVLVRELARHVTVVITGVVGTTSVDLQGSSHGNIRQCFAFIRHGGCVHSTANIEDVCVVLFHLQSFELKISCVTWEHNNECLTWVVQGKSPSITAYTGSFAALSRGG